MIIAQSELALEAHGLFDQAVACGLPARPISISHPRAVIILVQPVGIEIGIGAQRYIIKWQDRPALVASCSRMSGFG